MQESALETIAFDVGVQIHDADAIFAEAATAYATASHLLYKGGSK